MNGVGLKIEIIRGDITKQETDQIVNAANSSLMGGGGVDGAIHRAGGPAILEECKQIIARQGPCNTGEAVITTAGNLPSKFVIHTVGPVWHGGNRGEADQLARCYKNSLSLAVSRRLKTISFPNISTGIYGYPRMEACEIALETTFEFLQADSFITRVFFVCFDDENFNLYRSTIIHPS